MATNYHFVFNGNKYAISAMGAMPIAKTANRDLVWLGGAMWRMTIEGAAELPVYPFESIRFQTLTGEDGHEHDGLVLIAQPGDRGELELHVACPKGWRLTAEPA